ncbi:MAG: hypothetical protein A2511_16760 [Deltaproteobacteria bacterium RIFOXYD12_FULL_50_9]|nr:MAG: hypothetical protein A2511_16760 [Deltaproteobacteria bacterium RIFOXYD12_FULL_50_9]
MKQSSAYLIRIVVLLFLVSLAVEASVQAQDTELSGATAISKKTLSHNVVVAPQKYILDSGIQREEVKEVREPIRQEGEQQIVTQEAVAVRPGAIFLERKALSYNVVVAPPKRILEQNIRREEVKEVRGPIRQLSEQQIVIREASGPEAEAVRPGTASLDQKTRSYNTVSAVTPVVDLNMQRKVIRVPCQPLSEQQIAQNEIAASYLPIWNDRIKIANGFDDAEFDRHFVVTKVKDSYTTRGQSLDIGVCIKIDWFMLNNLEDRLWVLISPAFENTRNLEIPLNTYLTEDEINTIHDVYNHAWVIDITNPFLFKSKEEAIQKFNEVSGGQDSESQMHEILLQRDGILEPWLQGRVIVNEKENKCQIGSINLVTGEIIQRDILCRF